MPRLRALVVAVGVLLLSWSALAQSIHGIVVDETGLPLPGVRVELQRGDQTVLSVQSGPDGTFNLPAANPDDVVEATLKGFGVVHVPVDRASRIVLKLAPTSEEIQATASALTSSGVTMEEFGSVLTPSLIQGMATARPSALAALPLLPSVVRGPDGLLHLDGTRPHEAALLIDGFDVTDPVTGSSGIDLPVEAVKGVAVLRDPMDATFGGTLGALSSMETAEGGDQFAAGVQGFVPRPRFNPQGFGRIEAFFPRAYAAGRSGIVRVLRRRGVQFRTGGCAGGHDPVWRQRHRRLQRNDVRAAGCPALASSDVDVRGTFRSRPDGQRWAEPAHRPGGDTNRPHARPVRWTY